MNSFVLVKVSSMDFPCHDEGSRLPKRNRLAELPPNHPFVHRVFHYKPSILGGFTPIFGNAHISIWQRNKSPGKCSFYQAYLPINIGECYIAMLVHWTLQILWETVIS